MLIAVDCDGVEGASGGCEVLPVGLLTRLRSDRSRSCERVTGLHLEFDKELAFCTLGILLVHGEDNGLWITSISSYFSDIFP